MITRALLLVLVWCSCVQAATRVALVSTCEGDGMLDVLTLAQAKLSAEPGVEVVERTEVERVLREQKLWRCGLSSYGQAVAAGRLLGVEVFAALEVLPNEKEALGLVCFSAGSGARLMDVVLAKGAAPAVANAILGTVRDACIKQQLPGTSRNTVCILAVRNAGLVRGLDGVCESVGRMLERRLLSSPSLAVLERARLDQVNRERNLPVTGSATNTLRAALNQFELEFSHGTGSNDIHVTVFQSNAAGQALPKINADAALDRTADLVESISTQIITALQASPLVRKIDRRAEALRFSREAKFFHENGQDLAALQAAEAAVALDPANKNSRELLFLTLLTRANVLIGGAGGKVGKVPAEDLKQAFSLAQRGAQLRWELVVALPLKQRVAAAIRGNPSHLVLDRFVYNAGLLSAGFDAESRAEYTELEGVCRRIWLMLWQAVFDDMKTESDLGYGSGYCFYMYLGGIWGETNSAIWANDMLHGLDAWLERVNTVGVCRVHHNRTNWVLTPLLYQLRYPKKTMLHAKRAWIMEEADLEKVGGFFEKLKQHPEPLLQLYGRGGDLVKRLRQETQPSAADREQFAEMLRLGKATIADPSCPQMNYGGAVYQVLLDLLDFFPDREWRQAQQQELFEFMLARNEFFPVVGQAAVNPFAPDFAGYSGELTIFTGNSDSPHVTNLAPYAKNLERLIALADSPSFANLVDAQGYGRTEVDRQLMQLCQRLGVKPPAAIKKPTPLWSSAKLVWSGRLAGLVQPRIVGESLWALDSSQTPARLVRVPLDGGKVENYDRIPIPTLPDQHYAMVTTNGIQIFPSGAAAVSLFTEANGLPSGPISAAVCCDGKLYAAIGIDEVYRKIPSYLVRWDLKTGAVDLLASTLRKEKRSPLDSTSPPFLIRHMVADPARHQVLLTVDIGQNHQGTDFTGLWSLDTQTDQLTLLLPLAARCDWVSPIRGSEIVLTRSCAVYGCYYSVITFNLDTRKGQMIYSTGWAKADQYLTDGTAPPVLNSYTRFPHLLVDGWLWSGNPFCRVLTNGVPREFLPSFTGKSLGQIQYLEPVNQSRQILAGTDNQLWLLTLPENTSKDSP